eukprot:TRINITY_DN100390_c0_g1_i1.p1 TRINITY_DN100390_c0_g1~~TRINITY_DN100390_c0_g1_i1.p1  ORF type:complete len:406 (-),score=126.81 TRINITY_DN100390_c0_g1_i1:276-1493(-)
MGSPMDALADDQRTGQMSAWLKKKKSGTSMVRMREYNKRYFTLDFDARVFFYAHGENSKKVSSVIPFADILDVKAPEVPSDLTSETSKGSFIRRSFSLGGSKKAEKEQHLVTLLVRPSKLMELQCGSEQEAVEWMEALRSAVMLGSGASAGGASGSTAAMPGSPSSGGSSPQASGDVGGFGGYGAHGAAAATAGSGGYGGAAPAAAVAGGAGAATVGAEGARARESTAGEGEKAGKADDDSPADVPPPAAASSFLDLTIEEAPQEAAEEKVEEGDEIVVAPANINMSAADFGLDDMDSDSDNDSASASSEGLAALPIPPAAAGNAAADKKAEAQDDACSESSSPEVTAKKAGETSAAVDKNHGLSMQERLANLEFSDDEDEDDDDPLGLKQKVVSPKGDSGKEAD